jgi:hypothetical protein
VRIDVTVRTKSLLLSMRSTFDKYVRKVVVLTIALVAILMAAPFDAFAVVKLLKTMLEEPTVELR